MRYRVNDYTIDEQNNIVLPDELTIEDIRLIVNETQLQVICSSMQKSNVEVNGNLIEVPIDICTLQSTDQLTIEIDKGDSLADIQLPEVDVANLAKEQTLLDKAEEIKQAVESAKPEIDTAELAKEDTLLAESQRIQNEVRNIDFSTVKNKVDEVKQAVDNIDLSPIENKVQEESAAIQSKIDNIQLPEIDTDTLAKQGNDQEATNTAIYNAVNTILSRSVKYDKTTGNLTIENVELTIE